MDGLIWIAIVMQNNIWHLIRPFKILKHIYVIWIGFVNCGLLLTFFSLCKLQKLNKFELLYI